MKDKNNIHSGGNDKERLSDMGGLSEEKDILNHGKDDSGKKRHKPDIKEMEELRKKASDYDELWNKYLRVCADFDNARKRWDKEKQSLVKFANVSLIKNLLVIVDEFEHALRAIKEHSQYEKIIEGIELTYNNLRNILDKEGLKVIDARGKKFDPHIHEIVGQVENHDVDEHTVIEEVQKGYLLGDSLLRTSKVIIAVSGTQEKNSDDDGNARDAKNNNTDNEGEEEEKDNKLII